MADAIRTIPMRGISAAVARDELPQPGHAGIALGLDGTGADRRVALAVRHADGTMLTSYLSDDQLGRLADILAALAHPGAAAVAAWGTVQ